MAGPLDAKNLLLVLNAGPSSLKFAVFDGQLGNIASGGVSEIGENAKLDVGGRVISVACRSHEEALQKSFGALAEVGLPTSRISAVGHRVLHGGVNLTEPVLATPEVIAEIEACVQFAPLHNPHNLFGLNAISALAPDLPQVVCFDTAFHAGNSIVATSYALPGDYAAQGFRRFGFHGLSYASVMEALPDLTGKTLPRRLLAFHLGNGASACAIVEGRSVATTMGYSPLSGLTMGTRAGDIDGVAVLRLAEKLGLSEAESLLLDRSGLAGLSGGASDIADLLSAQTPEAAFAVEHFCYWAARHAGSMIAAMNGLDAIVFTGSIGENAPEIRTRIIGKLRWIGAEIAEIFNSDNDPVIHRPGSKLEIFIVPSNEEREIARQVVRVLSDQS